MTSPIVAKLQEEPIMELEYFVEVDEEGLVSTNKLYSTFRGKRNLNNRGKAVKARIMHATNTATMQLLDNGVEWSTALKAIYAEGYHVVLLIDLYWERMLNGSWKFGGSLTKPKRHKKTGEMRGGGNPQSPYQKKDATNYIKLIEDAVAQATGIDDSAHLLVAVMKHEDPHERVAITYRIHE